MGEEKKGGMGVRDIILPLWGGFCVFFWAKLLWVISDAFSGQSSEIPGVIGAAGVILTIALLIYIVNATWQAAGKAGW